jgi:hypothetical protein
VLISFDCDSIFLYCTCFPLLLDYVVIILYVILFLVLTECRTQWLSYKIYRGKLNKSYK